MNVKEAMKLGILGGKDLEDFLEECARGLHLHKDEDSE